MQEKIRSCPIQSPYNPYINPNPYIMPSFGRCVEALLCDAVAKLEARRGSLESPGFRGQSVGSLGFTA